MKKLSLLIVVVIVALVVVGFFGLRQIVEPQKQELTSISVQLRWVHQAGFAGLEVADAKGFYEDVGLAVTFKPVDLSQPIPLGADEIVSGRADFSELNSLEILQAFDQGKEIKAIMAMFQISPHTFVSLNESNITSPADFEGKTLGVLRNNATGRLLYPALLERFEIDPSNVDIIPVGFDATSILANREVDVVDIFRNFQPYEMDQAGLEYNMIFPEQYGLKGYDSVIVTSQKMMDENPEAVRAFVEATVKGWEYAFENRKEAIDIVLSYVTLEVYADRALEEFVFETQESLVRPTGGRTFGHMNFEQWFSYYNEMEIQGLIENEFDVSDVYTNEFIP